VLSSKKNFDSCEVAAHSWNRFGVANEETVQHPDIFVCRGLRLSWPEFWTLGTTAENSSGKSLLPRFASLPADPFR
jgi:hypothetical protein